MVSKVSANFRMRKSPGRFTPRTLRRPVRRTRCSPSDFEPFVLQPPEGFNYLESYAHTSQLPGHLKHEILGHLQPPQEIRFPHLLTLVLCDQILQYGPITPAVLLSRGISFPEYIERGEPKKIQWMRLANCRDLGLISYPLLKGPYQWLKKFGFSFTEKPLGVAFHQADLVQMDQALTKLKFRRADMELDDFTLDVLFERMDIKVEKFIVEPERPEPFNWMEALAHALQQEAIGPGFIVGRRDIFPVYSINLPGFEQPKTLKEFLKWIRELS